jgi:hypothetical protein
MLGVRREGVTEAALKLQKHGPDPLRARPHLGARPARAGAAHLRVLRGGEEGIRPAAARRRARSSACSCRRSARSVSAWACTDTYSPAAIDMAPATRPATPVSITTVGVLPAAAMPTTRLAVDTRPPLAPSTAARSQPDLLPRCNSGGTGRRMPLRWSSRRSMWPARTPGPPCLLAVTSPGVAGCRAAGAWRRTVTWRALGLEHGCANGTCWPFSRDLGDFGG